MSECLLTTSFALLREHGACQGRYNHLAGALGGVAEYGDTRPIPLTRILEVNGLNDALWALRAVPREQVAARDRFARLLACDYAERALPVWEAWAPTDRRPHETIAVARRYAVGEATQNELAAYAAAAYAAADAAYAAADAYAAYAAAAYAAAYAAYAAADAYAAYAAADAAAAAYAAAAYAAADAAYAAADAYAAYAAADAAYAAYSGNAERAWQTEQLRAALAGGPR